MSEIRNETFVGFTVTVGLAINLGIVKAAQRQSETMLDDDAWSSTTTIADGNTRDPSTRTDMEVLELAFSPEFYFRFIYLVPSGQQKIRWPSEHLMKGQEVIIEDQHFQSTIRLICNGCGQERHCSRGCAKLKPLCRDR